MGELTENTDASAPLGYSELVAVYRDNDELIPASIVAALNQSVCPLAQAAMNPP
jgi:hypothetical protein